MAEYIEREVAIRAVVEAVDAGLAITSDDLAEIIGDIDVAPMGGSGGAAGGGRAAEGGEQAAP